MSVTAAAAEPRRAGRELVLELVFRPPANLLVSLFERAKVPPPAVVLANAGVGLVAALVLYRGHLVEAALLLQLKTLLDNADGALARTTGRVTLTGRYLDTIADLVVNVAVFVSLAHVTGEPNLAAAAFLALTVVLAVDFNVTELYREAHRIPTVEPPASGSGVERVLAFLYRIWFGVLDRSVRWFSSWRLGVRPTYDGFTLSVLANLGLTTQLAVLGVCLVLGAPTLYLWLVLVCLLVLGALHVRAELRARAGS
ncbi:MAG TPA: CDP-alcohol phosphatidyltransferase family protein [Gaiellaceae bacterium]|nr:CDP-alcohol phosphatidyltransferase family protein [Gaiellaceae bacterium]